MTMQISDHIRSAPRGNPEQAIAALVEPDNKDREFVYALFSLAPQVGIDPAICVAQSYEESNWLRAPRWNHSLNPAGIGIPADNSPQPVRIPSATVAAQLYLTCLNRLVGKPRNEPWVLPAEIAEWVQAQWMAHITDPALIALGPVTTIDDLNWRYFSQKFNDSEATWAWDSTYQDQIVAIGNSVFPAIADTHSIEHPATMTHYPTPKSVHAVRGALIRSGASRSFPVIHHCEPGEALVATGFVHGQSVLNSDVWLKLAQGWIHQSGVVEPI